TSTDSGVTWVSNNVVPADWSAIASSADGSKLVGAVRGGGIWTWQSIPKLVMQTIASGLNRLEPNLAEDSDGNLFGVFHTGDASLPGGAYGDTLFKISPDGSVSVVRRFQQVEGAYPSWRAAINVVPGTNGAIYGTVSRLDGPTYGAVFRLETNAFDFVFPFNFTN